MMNQTNAVQRKQWTAPVLGELSVSATATGVPGPTEAIVMIGPFTSQQQGPTTS